MKTSENEKRHDNDAAMEDNAASATKVSSIKHGWCHAINNTVCQCQAPLKIALNLEQASDCNSLLREQVDVEKASHTRQNNVISDENSFVSKVCVKAKECTPNGFEEK